MVDFRGPHERRLIDFIRDGRGFSRIREIVAERLELAVQFSANEPNERFQGPEEARHVVVGRTVPRSHLGQRLGDGYLNLGRTGELAFSIPVPLGLESVP